MKKIIALLLLLTLIFTLAGCNNEKDATSEPTPSTTVTESKVESTTSENTSTVESTVESNATQPSASSSQETSSAPTPSSTPVTSVVSSKPQVSSAPAHTHSFAAATCTEPKKCSCGVTEGSALGHTYSAGKCTVCSAKDPNYFSLLSEDSYGVYNYYLEDPDKETLDAYGVSWNGGSNVKFLLTIYDPVDASQSVIELNGNHYGYPSDLSYPTPQNVQVTDTTLYFEIHNNGGVYKNSFVYDKGVLIYQGEDPWIEKGSKFEKK